MFGNMFIIINLFVNITYISRAPTMALLYCGHCREQEDNALDLLQLTF